MSDRKEEADSQTLAMNEVAGRERGLDLNGDRKEKPVRKRLRVYGEKICQVCGDKALAHHFGTLACETCKAFFRRNASIKEPRSCQFKGDCPVNVKTRRFCPACRLAKCFKVGMRADLILDEKEKKERNQKVNEKRQIRSRTEHIKQLNKSDDNPNCNSSSYTPSTIGHSMTNHTSLGESANMVAQAWRSTSEMDTVEAMSRSTTDSFSSPDTQEWNQEVHSVQAGYPTSTGVITDSKAMVLPSSQTITPSPASVELINPLTPSRSTSASSTLYSDLESWQVIQSPPSVQKPLSQTYTFRDFQHVPREELPSDPYMYWRLSEEERGLLAQLSAAYQDTLLAVLKGSPPRQFIETSVLKSEVCGQECEHEANSVVSFAKRMEDFRQLRQDEQIALLKASTCQALGIRGSALYIIEKDAWLTGMGYFTKEHSEILCPNNHLLEPCIQFNKIVKSIVKNDVTTYALLHCLCLFDPCDERVIDRQLISSIRDKYLILLRHYLESQFSYQHADRYMIVLQENMITYRTLCEEGRPLFKQWFPSFPSKLFMELLDVETD